MGGRITVESVAGIAWNMQALSPPAISYVRDILMLPPNGNNEPRAKAA
jgi:hypothetical protein